MILPAKKKTVYVLIECKAYKFLLKGYLSLPFMFIVAPSKI
jgi:hypothetical protein